LKSSDPKIREAAAVVYLISKTAFRIGGEEEKGDVKAYGASTLLNKHVRVSGDTVIFDFVAKKGVQVTQRTTDPALAKIVNDRKTSKWSDQLFNIGQGQVRSYFKSIAGSQFLVKDYRNWHATNMALELMSKKRGKPKSEKDFAKWQREVCEKTAAKLGHNWGESRDTYIDPHVWQKWRQPEWGDWVPKKLKSQVNDD
jgi:DNA topoisomerase-1